MPPLTTLHLAHLPPTLTIHIALYTSVANSPHLLAQLLAQNPTYNYAFIDATTILSRTHLLAAIYRASNDSLHNRLKSRNVHSEIVFSLGANNNIAQSLRAFGIGEGTREVVVVKVVDEGEGDGLIAGKGEEVGRQLDGVVEGVGVEWSDEALARVRDVGRIRKLYKLPAGAEQGGKAKRRRKDGDEVDEMKELEVAVLGLMALRGAV